MTAPKSQPDNLPIEPNDFIESHLRKIRIVMVNTTLPANIGSAARAMYTMGLQDLVVVDPKHPIDDETFAHAAGAKRVINNCRIVNNLKTAIADCNLIFAASSRQRHIPRPVVTPDEAANIMLNHDDNNTNIAILFGREDRGLTNSELAVADYHIQIDANPNYPVLNVASAIQVISSFIYSRFLKHSKLEEKSDTTTSNDIHKSDLNLSTAHSSNLSINEASNSDNLNQIELILRQEWDSPAITFEQKNKLQERTIDLMYDLELIESTEQEQLRDLPTRLSRLISRVQLDQKEYEIISSIIAKIKRNI